MILQWKRRLLLGLGLSVLLGVIATAPPAASATGTLDQQFVPGPPASNANRNRSRARCGAASTATTCAALKVRGVRVATLSLTGRVAIGRPLET